MKIRELIPLSPDRISRAELARAYDVTVREIQRMVTNARIHGEIIASDVRGYYIPVEAQELCSFYRVHRTRALTTLRSLKAVRATLMNAGVDIAKLESKR